MPESAARSRFTAAWAYGKLGIGLALAAVLVLFSVQNAGDVHVRFLTWEAEMSQALVALTALLGGAVVGVTVNSWLRWRARR